MVSPNPIVITQSLAQNRVRISLPTPRGSLQRSPYCVSCAFTTYQRYQYLFQTTILVSSYPGGHLKQVILASYPFNHFKDSQKHTWITSIDASLHDRFPEHNETQCTFNLTIGYQWSIEDQYIHYSQLGQDIDIISRTNTILIDQPFSSIVAYWRQGRLCQLCKWHLTRQWSLLQIVLGSRMVVFKWMFCRWYLLHLIKH